MERGCPPLRVGSGEGLAPSHFFQSSVLPCSKYINTIVTAPTDPAMLGAADPGGPSRLPENISFTVRHCSISSVYDFALLDKFVGTDPIRITYSVN